MVDLTGDVTDHSTVHALGEQRAVPANKVVRIGSALVARVVRENVIITTERRTSPYVCAGISVLLGVGEIGIENTVVDRSTEIARSEEMNAVEIGNVHTATVGGSDLVSKLVHVKHEEENIYAIPMLEEGNTLAAIGDGQLVAVVCGEERGNGLLQGYRGSDVAHHTENEGFLQVGKCLAVQAISWRLIEHLLVNTLQYLGREEIAERTGRNRH